MKYVSRHKIAFDFGNTTRAESHLDQTNIAVIDFFHGMNQPWFEAKIDSSGNVIETFLGTLMPGPGLQ